MTMIRLFNCLYSINLRIYQQMSLKVIEIWLFVFSCSSYNFLREILFPPPTHVYSHLAIILHRIFRIWLGNLFRQLYFSLRLILMRRRVVPCRSLRVRLPIICQLPVLSLYHCNLVSQRIVVVVVVVIVCYTYLLRLLLLWFSSTPSLNFPFRHIFRWCFPASSQQNTVIYNYKCSSRCYPPTLCFSIYIYIYASLRENVFHQSSTWFVFPCKQSPLFHCSVRYSPALLTHLFLSEVRIHLFARFIEDVIGFPL